MAFWPKKTDAGDKTGTSNADGAASPAHPSSSKLNDASIAQPGVQPAEPALPSDPIAPMAGNTSAAPPLTDEQRKDAAMASKLLMAGFGEIVSVLVRSQAYRTKPIAALEEIAVPAVLTGQFSLAQTQSSANGMVAPVGVVFWARVSPDVDQRLTQNIEAEPVRLQLAEWRSGPIIWIVDAVGEQKIIEAMLSRLVDTEWKGKEVRTRARTKEGSYKVGVLSRPDKTATAPTS